MNDKWIDELQSEVVDTDPRPGFQDELRDVLDDEWEGRTQLTASAAHRRTWLTRCAVAASLAVLLAALVAITRSDDAVAPATVPTDTLAPTPAPSTGATTTGVPTTGAPTSTPLPTTTAPPTTTSPPTSAPVPVGEMSWRLVSVSPLSERSGHSLVWTGDELLVWGGFASTDGFVEFADGAAYDPVSDTWRELPDAGIAGRLGHSAVWTGDAMLVWGGVTDFGCQTGSSDGAVYESATDQWRPISSAPGPVRTSHSAVWTGDEMIVWGGFPTQGTATSDGRFCNPPPDPDAELPGLAYNPLTDSWRVISAGPEPRNFSTLVAADDKVVVWGGISAASGDWLADGWSYDPATDRWSELPGGPLSARIRHVAAWTGEEMIVAGGQDRDGLLSDGAAFSPATGRWRAIAPLPAPTGGAAAAATGRYLLILEGCCLDDTDAFVFDLITGTWVSLQPVPSPPCGNSCSRFAPVASLGDGFVTWGGSTESGPAADWRSWAEGSLLDLSK
jgi:hypothetical protein